jgi:hypothetical protein
MGRRKFITLLGGTAAAFQEGLREAGYVEGRNVAIEYRGAATATNPIEIGTTPASKHSKSGHGRLGSWGGPRGLGQLEPSRSPPWQSAPHWQSDGDDRGRSDGAPLAPRYSMAT